MCKCVIPINSIEAYISKLASEEYNFVICKKEKFGMTELFRYEGNKSVGSLECNCNLCWYYDKRIGKSVEEQVSMWEMKYGKGRE